MSKYTVTVKSDDDGNFIEGADEYVQCLTSCLGWRVALARFICKVMFCKYSHIVIKPQ